MLVSRKGALVHCWVEMYIGAATAKNSVQPQEIKNRIAIGDLAIFLAEYTLQMKSLT